MRVGAAGGHVVWCASRKERQAMQDDKKAREEQEEGVQGKSPSHTPTRRKGAVPKARKISTLRGTFRDEWVAAEVTRVDKADVPMAGVLLTHSPDKRQVYQMVKAYLAEHPGARVFIFFAGEPIPEGVGVALALR